MKTSIDKGLLKNKLLQFLELRIDNIQSNWIQKPEVWLLLAKQLMKKANNNWNLKLKR